MRSGVTYYVVLTVVLTLITLGMSGCQTGPTTREASAEIPPAATSTAIAVEKSTGVKAADVKLPEPIKPITPEMARNLANNCFTCHGPAGKSPGSIPSLTKFNAADMAVRLKRFKSGEDPSTVMGRQAKGYTDAELEAVASYIAGLKK